MKPHPPKPYGTTKFARPTRRPEDAPPAYGPRPYRGGGGGGGYRGRARRESEDYGGEEYSDRPFYQRRPYSNRPYEERYRERPRQYRPRAERRSEHPREESGYEAAMPAPAGPPPASAPPPRDPQLEQRLKRVKLFLCDVDGILTDAGVFMGNGEETKRFNIRDGFGLRLLQRQGVKVGWVSHRASIATTKRAEDLQVDYLHQAPGSKVEVIENILAQTNLTWDDVCFMGDDIVDLGPLKRAGLAVTVGQGIPEVKALAHYVTKAAGGHGAVREVAEMILKAQDKWAPLVAEYSA